MPLPPQKPGKTTPELRVSSYLPAHTVDDTLLPEVEDEGFAGMLRDLPRVARAGVVVLPLLLFIFLGWGVSRVLGEPSADGSGLALHEGRTATPSLIGIAPQAILATVEPGATTAEATTTVTTALTLTPAPTLDPAPTLAPTLTPAPTSTPTLDPTPAPAPPTPAPATPEPARVVAAVRASLLISPTMGSGIVVQVPAGTAYEPLLRTPDAQWFLVREGEQVAWLAAGESTIEPDAVARVPVTTPSPEAVAAGPLRATAVNGANIRFLPNTLRGAVLGQVQAGDVVTLQARSANGQWYRVVAPAADGWVGARLLDVPPEVAASLPVGD
jgi:hypothetical protein